MELKKYQKTVISDLSRYMEILGDTRNINSAWTQFWNEKGVNVGFGGVPSYQNILPGTPDLCIKVPTGGGKTYLACNAIKPVFDGLPATKTKAVVWLVPSEAILTQTLAALKNPDHPYRQKINADFGSRVEVYTKQELLNGQNFNITTVTEQLSIMVLSYDSFRGRKEALKAKQENSVLAPMAAALGTPEISIEDAEESSLLQVISQLSPLVVVDESHHARSKLSKEMLRNFNPCFVLDLTATPTKESNILSYVDAVQLKRENMVKLPVIVYNRNSQQDVLTDAIDLRNRLEEYAKAEQATSGRYIRPIALLQAQPKGKEDAETFEKLRLKLVQAGIPSDQIAIKTADTNELRSVDLMSSDCPIRYIITVNALKEGWDCPFAYVLASLANKSSRIDVEQIVGRVLRQPYAQSYGNPALNMSFVLTSSADFKATLDNIVKGLNGCGFSSKDCRVADEPTYQAAATIETPATVAPAPTPVTIQPVQTTIPLVPSWAVEPSNDPDPDEEFFEFDPNAVAAATKTPTLPRTANTATSTTTQTHSSGADTILENAWKEQEAFEKANGTGNSGNDVFVNVPTEIQEKMSIFRMNSEFEDEAKELRIPQFFRKITFSVVIGGHEVLLKKDTLGEEFSLKGKPYDINFTRADDEIFQIDVRDLDGGVPKAFQMSENDQRYIKDQFSKYSPEQKIRACKEIMHNLLNRMNCIDSEELRIYIDLVVGSMDRETLSALEQAPNRFAATIKEYIEGLLEEHYEKQFREWIETGEIVCMPNYAFPDKIGPMKSTTTFGKSLYQGEEDTNGFEYDMITALTSLPNVKWWHRNISRQGFAINGFVNHYPDFIVRTTNGRTVIIETKGDHLANEDNRKKLAEGRIWQDKANHGTDEYRYYMVFQSKDSGLEGAYPMDKFLDIMKKL